MQARYHFSARIAWSTQGDAASQSAPLPSSEFGSSFHGRTLMVTPKSPASGPAGYNIFTVYGGLDGTKDQASAVLDREAKRLCA